MHVQVVVVETRNHQWMASRASLASKATPLDAANVIPHVVEEKWYCLVEARDGFVGASIIRTHHSSQCCPVTVVAHITIVFTILN